VTASIQIPSENVPTSTKKRKSRVVRVLGRIGIGILILFILIASFHWIAFAVEGRELENGNGYGDFVTVNGEQMSYRIDGTGENVIVLLGAMGMASPVLEYEPLTAELAKSHTVVTLEYFGYGRSSKTSKERTIENIAAEVHSAIWQLGYSKYTLMGHSVGGLYGLYYANQYPDELAGFVGLDPTVPQQIASASPGDGDSAVSNARFYRALINVGIGRIWTMLDPSIVVNDARLSSRDRDNVRIMYLHNLMSHTLVNEEQHFYQNLVATQGMTFPQSVPVLTLRATETETEFPDFALWDQELLGGSQFDTVKPWPGGHGTGTWPDPTTTANDIAAWEARVNS